MLQLCLEHYTLYMCCSKFTLRFENKDILGKPYVIHYAFCIIIDLLLSYNVGHFNN